MKKIKRRGFVLASLALVMMVLIILTVAVLSLGTSGLRVATHDQQSEQALYCAEAGLTMAAEELARTGDLPQPYEATDSYTQATYEVELFRNETTEEATISSGLVLPPNTVYLRSTGSSRNGTQRVAGALFRSGLGAFQVGALAEDVEATNVTFDAYDSGLEAPGFSGPGYDPVAQVIDKAILASNESSGSVFNLADTTVSGGVLVGPGGDTSTQITKSGSTTVSSESVLSQAIEIEDFSIPSLPSMDENQAEHPVSEGTQTNIGNLTCKPLSTGGVSFSNSCLSLSVQPNGDFVATENPASSYAGGPLRIEGNIHDMRDGAPPTLNTGNNKNGPTGFDYTIEDGAFALAGSWHFFKIDGDGTATADNGPSSIVGGNQTGQMTGPTVSAPDWLTEFLTGAPAGFTENPLDLQPGSYDTLTIDSVQTELQDGGVYVIKTLNVEGSGQLVVPEDAGEVIVYVTDSLNVEGEDALVNQTRKAPNLTVVYTGNDPVNLAGGSQAFFTLMAEGADIKLTGPVDGITDFFGALVGSTVTTENAAFHYDIATAGVGLGVDSSKLTLLSRHR